MTDLQDVPAPAAAAHPGTSARPAGDLYERAAGLQAPGKEAPQLAYAVEWARPYPPTTDRITPYEGAPRREQALPFPTPTEEILKALRATRASTILGRHEMARSRHSPSPTMGTDGRLTHTMGRWYARRLFSGPKE